MNRSDVNMLGFVLSGFIASTVQLTFHHFGVSFALLLLGFIVIPPRLRNLFSEELNEE